jgi:hypothetical protein
MQNNDVTIEIVLIVTPKMRDDHARKNRKPLTGDLRTRETAEYDLGDVDNA